MPVTTTPTLRDLDPSDIVDQYHRRGLDRLPDAALVDLAADIIGRPKLADPTSFILHAPLELLARTALLQHAAPGAREAARMRIAWVAATYDEAGPSTPLPEVSPADATAAVDALSSSIRGGELAEAAALGAWLGRHVEARRLVSLVADTVVDSLAAASHGPIFLHLLPRVAPRSEMAATMFATMTHELARHPAWRLQPLPLPDRTIRPLTGALASTPVIGPSGAFGIYSTMTFTESSGVFDDIVTPAVGADVDVNDATVSLLRVATASMLLDDPDHAPYGWTHTLTIPQAMASVAPLARDPRRALATAAAHLVGFRATEGRAPLHTVDPSVARAGLVSELGHHLPIQDVIDHAVVHPDAHLAKYVLACLDATRTDPAGAAQHLAAAAHLDEWWRQVPATDDPIAPAFG